MKIWDMESGEFDSCWCAEDGCCENVHDAGWDPAIVALQEGVAMQVAEDIVTRMRRPRPVAIEEEVDGFLQRMYVFQR
jgi:uncharacterized protein CbrC (UPF0167 family)